MVIGGLILVNNVVLPSDLCDLNPVCASHVNASCEFLAHDAYNKFLPHDALHKRGLCRCVVCLFVCHLCVSCRNE